MDAQLVFFLFHLLTPTMTRFRIQHHDMPPPSTFPFQTTNHYFSSPVLTPRSLFHSLNSMM